MIKKKNNYLILFGLLFSIFLIPKDVFASSNRACSLDERPCMAENYVNMVGDLAQQVEDLTFLNLEIGDTVYKAYFFYGYDDLEAMDNWFDISDVGLSLVKPTNPYDTLEGNSFLFNKLFSSSVPGFFSYEDLYSKLPYFSLFKADRYADYVLVFSYSPNFMLYTDESYTTPQLLLKVPYSSDIKNNLAAITFSSIYKNDSDKVIVFSFDAEISSTPNSQFTDMFFCQHNAAYPFILNDLEYFNVNNFSKYFDGNNYLESYDSLLSNDLKFSSNSDFIDSNGSKLDYSNFQDISNSSSSNALAEFGVPTSLEDLLLMIPKMLKQMVSAFAVVGTIFTIAMSSFPPIITVGLYSVFILGILILIIKCLK